MSTNKIIIAIIAILVVIAGGWYAVSKGGVSLGQEKVVAIVNGEEITQEEYKTLYDQLKQSQGLGALAMNAETETALKEQVLETLIGTALVRQAIAQSDITISDEEFESQMGQIRAQFESDEAYNEALKAQNTTEEALRADVRSELIRQKYFESKLNLSSLSATDAEIEGAYAQIVESGQEVPPLDEVRAEVRQFVLGQKQQELLNAHISTLRTSAEIEIKI